MFGEYNTYDERDKLLWKYHKITLLANKIVYARSCDAGSHIGQLCILNKTLSFIGYKRKYALLFYILKIKNN